VAHAEGKFAARDERVLAKLNEDGRFVLRYCLPFPQTVRRSAGQEDMVPYPYNPNGSQECVAGVCDATGRIFGLMPHPERFIDRTQHPRWTRTSRPEVGDGLAVFQNAVRYFR
jgi:phosphoribosylformylglycinamidine synthase